MATLQRTGLGNLKGKHIAIFVRKHSHNHENSEEGEGGERSPLVDVPPCCNLC